MAGDDTDLLDSDFLAGGVSIGGPESSLVMCLRLGRVGVEIWGERVGGPGESNGDVFVEMTFGDPKFK